MKRIALGLVIAVSIMAIMGTGAFTTMATGRIATINVVSDDVALLSLAPCTGVGMNGMYFTDQDSDGAYELSITSTPAGVNVDTEIVIKDIFSITNNGDRDITVTFTDSGNHPGATDFGSLESGVLLSVGQSINVSLTIITQGIGPDVALIDSLTIFAE